MSKTAFEQLIDKLGNMSGGHLPPRGAEIARIAWNAAIDAAAALIPELWDNIEHDSYTCEVCYEQIQKLRSE